MSFELDGQKKFGASETPRDNPSHGGVNIASCVSDGATVLYKYSIYIGRLIYNYLASDWARANYYSLAKSQTQPGYSTRCTCCISELWKLLFALL